MTASVARETESRPAVLEWLRVRIPEAVVAAAAGVSGVLLYVEGRGTSFFYDEWSYILQRRGNDLDAFLAPHNGHLTVVPVLVYRLLFALVGLRHYGPYRLTVIALHLACGVLFFLLVRNRIDRRVAALATVLVLFLGTAWQALLWPFQMTFLGSIAAGLGALLALERNSRRWDVAASGLLALSLACSGLGIPFLLGAALQVGWDGRRRARAWVVAAPAVLYAIWYLVYGESEASLSNLRYVPAYVANAFAGTLGAITGLGTDWARPMAVVAALFVLARLFGKAPITRRMSVVALVLLSFWSLTALTRAQFAEPDASRYLYPGAILLLLVAVELTTRAIFSPRDLAVLGVLVLGAVLANFGALRDGAGQLRGYTRLVDAELAAVELERSVVPSDYRPDPTRAPVITAGPYLAAVDDLGSPATPIGVVERGAPEVRAEVDRVFAGAGLAVEPGHVRVAGPAPEVEPGLAPRQAAGSCVRAPQPQGSTLDVTATRSFAVLPRPGTSVQLAVRRLGDGFTAPIATVSGDAARIRIPDDGLQVPWRIELVGSGPFAVCGTS